MRTSPIVFVISTFLFLAGCCGNLVLPEKGKTATGEIKLNQTVRFDNGLSLTLKSFSHKRPYVGGPTKATAYLYAAKGFDSGEIELSVYGVEGKTDAEDGLTDEERYDALVWKSLLIRLRGFQYDRSVEVEVSPSE